MLQDLFECSFFIKIMNKLLFDQDKINIISTNKFLNSIRTKFTYDKGIHLCEFRDVWYYDCLTIISTCNVFKFPKSLKSLIFTNHFNKNVKGFIPDSVTYLKFGFNFRKNLEGCLPDSIIYLFLGELFQKKLTKFPKSLKYLRATWELTELNYEYIPKNITCETF